jgi:hypothetical protein
MRLWAGSVGSLVFKAVVEFVADVVFPNPNTAPDNHIENRSDLCVVVVGDFFALTKKSAFVSFLVDKLSFIGLDDWVVVVPPDARLTIEAQIALYGRALTVDVCQVATVRAYSFEIAELREVGKL